MEPRSSGHRISRFRHSQRLQCGICTTVVRPGNRCAGIHRCRHAIRDPEASRRRRSPLATASRRQPSPPCPVSVHDVIGRHSGQFGRCPAFQAVRPVARPVRAFVMVVGAQKRVHALPAMHHVGVGFACRVIPLVVLARPIERGQRLMDGIGRRQGRRGRGAGEWRAHHRDGAENIRPQQGAPGRDRRAEIVPDNRLDRDPAERLDQADDIAHQVHHAEGRPGRRRNPGPSRWCGRIPAGPVRLRNSRPRASAGITLRQE